MPNFTIAASKIRANEIIAARLEMSRKIAIAKAEAAEHEKQLIEKAQREFLADFEKYGTSEFSTEYLEAKSAYEKETEEEEAKVKDETKTHLGYGGCARNANIPMDEALEVEENDENLKASASPDGLPVLVPKRPTTGRRSTI